jgi:hypothetical protein
LVRPNPPNHSRLRFRVFRWAKLNLTGKHAGHKPVSLPTGFKPCSEFFGRVFHSVLFCRFSHFAKVSILSADKTLTDIFPACQPAKQNVTHQTFPSNSIRRAVSFFCVFGQFLPIRHQFWHHRRQPEERKGSF